MSKEKDLKVALAKVDILQHRIAELHRNAAKNLEKKTVKRKVMAEKVPASRPLPTPPTPHALPKPEPQQTETGGKKWLIIGIPTVPRTSVDYLTPTVEAIIQK